MVCDWFFFFSCFCYIIVIMDGISSIQLLQEKISAEAWAPKGRNTATPNIMVRSSPGFAPSNTDTIVYLRISQFPTCLSNMESSSEAGAQPMRGFSIAHFSQLRPMQHSFPSISKSIRWPIVYVQAAWRIRQILLLSLFLLRLFIDPQWCRKCDVSP